MANAPVLKTGGLKGPCRFESYALRSPACDRVTVPPDGEDALPERVTTQGIEPFLETDAMYESQNPIWARVGSLWRNSNRLAAETSNPAESRYHMISSRAGAGVHAAGLRRS